jgi:aminotransferase
MEIKHKSGSAGETRKARAMHLLHQTGVACVPGEAFYHDDSGEALARFRLPSKIMRLKRLVEG